MNDKRAGTLTLGFVLIAAGGLFLAKLIGAPISYEFIASCWPIVFILLGVEVLIGAKRSGNDPIRYDVAAIVLTFLLCFFAMAMAGLQFLLDTHLYWMTY